MTEPSKQLKHILPECVAATDYRAVSRSSSSTSMSPTCQQSFNHRARDTKYGALVAFTRRTGRTLPEFNLSVERKNEHAPCLGRENVIAVVLLCGFTVGQQPQAALCPYVIVSHRGLRLHGTSRTSIKVYSWSLPLRLLARRSFIGPLFELSAL